MRSSTPIWLLVVAAVSLGARSGLAAEANGCAHFTWDVSRELTVMKQTPQAVTAATKIGAQVPLLHPETLYEVKLSPQAAITYAVTPGKPTSNDGAQGGLARFHVNESGTYRISIASGHWIDVIADDQLVKSKRFQGSRGCERPHKIVEFDLPAGKQLLLQFSGSADAAVLVAITRVKTASAI